MLITIHRIRKLIHIILLKFYYAVLGIKNRLLWRITEAKSDFKAISGELGIIKIKPILSKEWHIDTKYFCAITDKKKYFVKKTSNKTVSVNETRFYKYLKESDSELYGLCVNTCAFVDYGEYVYIIQDYYELKTLENFKPREENAVKNAINTLFFISDRLYTLGICHNDIREGNFFCDCKGNIKLFDFGYACFWNENKSFSESLSDGEKFNLNHHERPSDQYLDDSFSFLSVMKKIDSNMYSSYPEYWLTLNQRIGTRQIDL